MAELVDQEAGVAIVTTKPTCTYISLFLVLQEALAARLRVHLPSSTTSRVYSTSAVPLPPTTTATTTIYSGEVIPNQAFSTDLHVKPVFGYYFCFTADLLHADVKEKVDAETLNKIALLLSHCGLPGVWHRE